MADYTLYGADFSMYSGKARAYLRYKLFDFEDVAATVGVYKKIIIPKTGVKYVPVVKTPTGDYLQDTTNIIDHLEELPSSRKVYPTTPKQRLVSLLLELFGDEWLVMPAMHYRWNFDSVNQPFIYKEFGGIVTPKMPGFIKHFVGKRLGARFKGAVPKIGITEKSIPALEAWFETELLPALNEHLCHYDFLLGSKPCIADFGFIASFWAHLGRDPFPKKLIEEQAPFVFTWIERMKDASMIEGELLKNDQIPETIYPILKSIFEIQWPILEDTSNRLTDWYAKETNGIAMGHSVEIPRTLGQHNFKIGDCEEKRSVLPYSQWRMQRPLNYYLSLTSEEKQQVDPLLKEVNGLYAMRFKVEHQVMRENNKFVIK
ncbi:MAG: glutathione S-transferase [Kangiellaceae bacterium]